MYTYYSAMRAYSKKNGWKLASPAEAKNGGRVMGSLVGICGRVLRCPDNGCLETDRDDDDDVSLMLDFDILKTTLLTSHQTNDKMTNQIPIRN